MIQKSVEKIGKRLDYFKKKDVITDILNHSDLGIILSEINHRYREWDIDQIIIKYIERKTAKVLQKKDEHGIRLYECYAIAGMERRWMRTRAMTVGNLRAVISDTRTFRRRLEIKEIGYDIFLRELEKLDKNATVDQVYNQTIDEIHETRSEESS